MSYVDAIILAVVAFFLVKGWLKGFFLEFFAFVGLVAGLVAAIRTNEVAARMLVQVVPIPRPLAQVILFVLVLVVIAFLFGGAGRLLKTKTEAMKVRHVDRSLGTLFGAAKGLLLCGLALYFIQEHPAGAGLKRYVAGRSLFSDIALRFAEWIVALFAGT